MSQCLTPIPELPGFKLPWRERLQPPLHPSIRRPVTETRSFLDLGLDDAPNDPAPALPRRLADHIDEFRLIGHGSLLAKRLAFVSRPVCSQLLNELLRECLEVEAGVLPSFVLTRFLYANLYPPRIVSGGQASLENASHRHSLMS